MRPDRTLAYWVTQPGVGELRNEPVPTAGPEESTVRADFGSVSPGTERLVGLGLGADGMACRYMAGELTLPVKYGYSLVGTGIDGALAGQRVFVMHPHQALVTVRDEHALPLPETMPSPRATLIPNTETALNAVWDAELVSDDAVLVVGGGPIGLLLAFVLWRQRGRGPTVVDVDADRLEQIARLPFVDGAVQPDSVAAESHAIAFHTTGAAAGLQTALGAVGFEGRVIELSWFGREPVEVDLGARFHFGRKRIIASQVGAIAPSRRGTIDYADRLAAVLELLADPAAEALLSPPIPFRELPERMRAVYGGNLTHPIPLIDYS